MLLIPETAKYVTMWNVTLVVFCWNKRNAGV